MEVREREEYLNWCSCLEEWVVRLNRELMVGGNFLRAVTAEERERGKSEGVREGGREGGRGNM